MQPSYKLIVAIFIYNWNEQQMSEADVTIFNLQNF